MRLILRHVILALVFVPALTLFFTAPHGATAGGVSRNGASPVAGVTGR
jgi:hypothetical protein